MTQTAAYTLPLPAVPRPITRRVVRRSWGEGPVRFWWMSAILIVLVTTFVASGYVQKELKHRSLIANGALVNATAVRVAGVTKHENANFSVIRDQTVAVEFNAVMPDGTLATFGGYLEPKEGR